MKTTKIVTLAALGLALPALAELQSANIVGYQTIPLEPGAYTMFSVPFCHVNNDGKGLMLNSDLTFANATKNEDAGPADQIWVWIPQDEGYDRFFYYAGDYGEGWCITTGNQDFFEDIPKYAKGLPQGSAVYYKAKKVDGKTVTGAGAIDSADEVEIPVVSGAYTMIANPYPVATKLNDASCVTFENATMNEDVGPADQIWVWMPKAEGYERFFFYTGSYGTGWCVSTGNQDWFEEVPGYESGIPSGTAFFFKAKAGAGKSVVFKNPVK